MSKIMEIKQEVLMALKASYSDIIEFDDEIATRFERMIEFLNHEAQPYTIFEQENKAVCQYLKSAANSEKHLINALSINEIDALDNRRKRLLELKQKVENIF